MEALGEVRAELGEQIDGLGVLHALGDRLQPDCSAMPMMLRTTR
jgi:hypothetical protein